MDDARTRFYPKSVDDRAEYMAFTTVKEDVMSICLKASRLGIGVKSLFDPIDKEVIGVEFV
jgi:hypothetical protein